jgi:hypothetical protein
MEEVMVAGAVEEMGVVGAEMAGGPAPVVGPAMVALALVVALMERARALTAPGPALAELTAMAIARVMVPPTRLRQQQLRLPPMMQRPRRLLRPMMLRRRHQWLLLPLLMRRPLIPPRSMRRRPIRPLWPLPPIRLIRQPLMRLIRLILP